MKEGWKSVTKMKNHQPRLREVAWVLLSY